jgi:hypothetical protein
LRSDGRSNQQRCANGQPFRHRHHMLFKIADATPEISRTAASR